MVVSGSCGVQHPSADREARAQNRASTCQMVGLISQRSMFSSTYDYPRSIPELYGDVCLILLFICTAVHIFIPEDVQLAVRSDERNQNVRG